MKKNRHHSAETFPPYARAFDSAPSENVDAALFLLLLFSSLLLRCESAVVLLLSHYYKSRVGFTGQSGPVIAL